jgi:hypothetical protein
MIHDGCRMRSTTAIRFRREADGTMTIYKRVGGKTMPVDAWGGTNYGWFTNDAPVRYRDRKFLLRNGSVWLSPSQPKNRRRP